MSRYALYAKLVMAVLVLTSLAMALGDRALGARLGRSDRRGRGLRASARCTLAP